jgi:hypothetical protein
MSLNIIIGVGGTGAKIVEAVLHLASCGLGPDDIKVGLVDQDHANGNVTRAVRLLKTIQEARGFWRSAGGQHRISATNVVPVDLLGADVEAISPGFEAWTPHVGKDVSLSGLLGSMPQEDKFLFDLLFLKGPAEQDMLLDEGYQRRPHIGSAAITARLGDEDAFWKRLVQLVRQSQDGTEVRLLLASSVFGGTGAAGFPTFARIVRRKLREEGILRNIRIGGVLMLPYFSFKPSGVNAVEASHLLLEAQAALNYYHAAFKDRRHYFDEVYLVGWAPAFHLDYYSSGAGSQENPALAPELVGALGACRFLDPAWQADAAFRSFVCAREEEGSFNWDDLPSPSGDVNGCYLKLGQAMRFAVVWKYWAKILSQPKTFLDRTLYRDPWFVAQQVDGVDYVNGPPGRGIRHLDDYVNELLRWAASIQLYAEASGLEFNLWNANALLVEPPDFSHPNNLVEIKPTLSDREYREALKSIVHAHAGSADPPSGNALLRDLNERRFHGDHQGLGRMVAALYAYCAVADRSAA